MVSGERDGRWGNRLFVPFSPAHRYSRVRDGGYSHPYGSCVDVGGAGAGLHPDGAGEGLAGECGGVSPCAPQCLEPVLTVLGLQFGSLLAGAIVTETIFAWPGIGRLTLTAITNRDYALVQGCILAIGLTYVAVNLLTDALYALADPRLRR